MKLSTADRLITALELFRTNIDRELPTQVAQFFLELYRNPEHGISWYADRLDLTKSTISRTVKLYSDRTMKEPILSMEFDQDDHRLRVIKLTRRGATLVENILERFEQKEREL